MVERSGYSHGEFSWVDLLTHDPVAAQGFYGELFGLDFVDEVDDAGEVYTIGFKDGLRAVGLLELSSDLAASGVPSNWETYINVDDLEATCAAVPGAGGTIIQTPIQASEAGNLAVFADPSGAVALLWESKTDMGPHIIEEHGTGCWHALVTGDADAALGFYSELLGWTGVPTGMDDLIGIAHNGAYIASAVPAAEGVPPHWAVYFAVEDCDATVANCQRLGGSLIVPAMDHPPGRMAMLADPQGVMFWVAALNPDFSMTPP